MNARQVGATAWFVSAALWIQLCVFLQRSERTPGRCNGLVRFRCIVDSVVRFLQRSERTPGRCNGLVRFRCIVDSVVRFLQRSERTPGRCNGFGSFPLHCGFSCAFFLQRSERTPGRCNGFGSFPLHCGFSCAFFCNAVNARQVGATVLVRFRCSGGRSVVRFLQRSERTPASFFATQCTPGRCNGFGSFPLHCGFSCAFFATQ